MTHLIYGDGRIKTNKGKTEGRPCLTLLDTGITRMCGTTSNEGPTTEPQENFDVIISFRNIESARVLQDMLNELVAEWARELSPKVDAIPVAPTPETECAIAALHRYESDYKADIDYGPAMP